MSQKDEGYTGFWKVMLIVLVIMAMLGLVALAAAGCRVNAERDRQRAFCIKQGYADVQYWINQDYCIGYRDGVLITAPITELKTREE